MIPAVLQTAMVGPPIKWSEAAKACLYQMMVDDYWTPDQKSQRLNQEFHLTYKPFDVKEINREISRNWKRYKNAVYMEVLKLVGVGKRCQLCGIYLKCRPKPAF